MRTSWYTHTFPFTAPAPHISGQQTARFNLVEVVAITDAVSDEPRSSFPALDLLFEGGAVLRIPIRGRSTDDRSMLLNA